MPAVPEGVAMNRVAVGRRRQIGVQAGRALEILGHAIEYLTDELVVDFGNTPESWSDGRVEAIQLLMATNREIYRECPEVPTLAERIRALISVLGSSHER